MSRHPPVPDPTPSETSVPTWTPVQPDPDLEEATREDLSLDSWVTSLAEQGQTAIDDSLEEQLYSQAPDALRQAGVDATAEEIETWVSAQMRRARP